MDLPGFVLSRHIYSSHGVSLSLQPALLSCSSGCIDALASLRARDTPGATALFQVDSGINVTYQELNACVEVLSAAISRRINECTGTGERCGSRYVVSTVDDGRYFIPSILATMRAGCAYIPVDSATPEGRFHSIVEDCLAQMESKAKLIVLAPAGSQAMDLRRKAMSAGEDLSCRLDICEVELLADEEAALSERSRSTEPGPTDTAPEDGVTANRANTISHIIYTSGSTGKPKGVVCTHKALLKYSTERMKVQGIDSSSRILLTSAHVWDPMLGDLATSLLSGAILCVCPRALLVCSFQEMVKASLATHVACTPSLWGLLGDGEKAAIPRSVRVVSLGGEVMSQSMLDQWSKRVTLLNTYGVTEVTAYQTYHKCQPLDNPRCAGLPLPGVHLGVLRDGHIYTSINERHTGAGAYDCDVIHDVTPGRGELVLSGEQLAEGYFNDELLTKAKFIRGSDMGIWYRSGDLVNIGQGGHVEVLGRLDNQIKLNGFRIELGSVEHAVMCSRSLVNSACAVVHDGKLWCVVSGSCDEWIRLPDNEQRMWKDSASNALHAMCSAHLLPHERPVGYLWKGSFPLTAGGKMSREGVQEWADSELRERHNHGTASCPNEESTRKISEGTESIIADVWSEVLGVDRADMSPASHFFFLGGNSTLAVEMLNNVKERLSITGKDADADKVRWCGLYRRPWLRDFSTVVTWSLAPSPNAEGGAMGFVKQQTNVYDEMAELEKKVESVSIEPEGSDSEKGTLANACTHGMILAARRGWVKLLAGLLDIRVSLNVCIDGAMTHKNKVEVSPLMAASFCGNIEAASLLVSAGAKVNTFTAQGLGPAHSAIHGASSCVSQCGANCHVGVLRFLLCQGAVTECRDINRWTLMHHAAWYGVLYAVRDLVDQGADIESKDKWKRTPLSWAIYNKHVDVAKYLISKGAKVDSVVREGDRPRKQPQLSHLKRTNNHWSTSFHLAIQPGLKGTGNEGSPLTQQREQESDEDTVLELVKLIVGTGNTDVNQPDAAGKTPKDLAKSLGYVKVLMYLDSCG